MQVVQQLRGKDSVRKPTPSEMELGKKIFSTNLSYKPGENILIVTDTTCLNEQAAIWFEVAKTLPQVKSVTMLVLDGMRRSGEEPPQEVCDACSQADISLLHTYYSLTHTQAGKAIRNSGHRGFSLPGVTYEIMMRTLGIDYEPVRELGLKLKTALDRSQRITITSDAGTNITATIRKNGVIADIGFVDNGEIGNLPAGEVFFSPPSDSTNGIWVVNGTMADVEEGGIDQPIQIEIEDGMAVKISGGEAAKRLEAALETEGPLAFHVAEIGIGINPEANPHGKLIEAEKAYATAHLALGNSSAIGGSIDIPIHLDGLTLAPTITLDDTTILENSAFKNL